MRQPDPLEHRTRACFILAGDRIVGFDDSTVADVVVLGRQCLVEFDDGRKWWTTPAAAVTLHRSPPP